MNGTIKPPTPYIAIFLKRIVDASLGLYFTPLMASGISAGIIRALKITADSMALFGEDSAMMLSLFASGIAAAKIAGMLAKYLATSLTMLNVVMAPRVIRSGFPIDTTAISFDGSLSRSTMFSASFLP